MAAAMSACSGGSVNLPSPVVPTTAPGPQIQHVVVIMQENRTFDGVFQGYPGANTQSFGFDSHGNKWNLQPISLAYPTDINHLRIQFLANYDGGRMDGFDKEIFSFTSCPVTHDFLNDPSCWVYGTHFPPGSTTPLAYAYVPRTEVQPFWDMAAQYAIGDNFFPSNNGPSYVSHQYMIAGESGHVAEIPSDFNQTWGCDAPAATLGVPTVTALLAIANPQPGYDPFPQQFGMELPGPFPCFSYATIATQLDNKGISWGFYSPTIGLNLGDIWSAFDVIYPVRFGADWVRNVKSPESSFFTDISKRQSAASFVGHAVVLELRSRRLAEHHRAAMGCQHRQCGRQEQVLEQYGHHHHVRRLGRLVRSRCAAAIRRSAHRRIRRAWASARR